jgi:hypothetical protein
MRFYVHLERNSKITSRRKNYSNIQHEMLKANAKVNTPPCKLTYFSAEVYMSSYLEAITTNVPQLIHYASVSQTVVHGVSSGGLQTVSEEKALQKLYQTLNE